MSAFDQTTDESQTPATTEETPSNQEDFLSQLVANKGEQWKDPQVLAKGKLESDRFIEKLQGELEELRGLKTQKNFADELLAKLQEGKAPVEPVVKKPDNAQAEANTQPSESDIESLIEKTLTERAAKQTTQQNINQVDKALSEAYGTEASKKVSETAANLGMTVGRLQEIAGESPQAFMALMGKQLPKSSPVTNTQVNTEANMGYSQKRGAKYYSDLRKENPTLYRNAKTQTQMIKDRQELGPSFYEN